MFLFFFSSPQRPPISLTHAHRNTKVKFFTKYAEGVDVFRKIASQTPEPNAMSHLLSLDQEKTCHIAQAADLCLMLTNGLDESKEVFKQQGRVIDAAWANVRRTFPPPPFFFVLPS